MKIYEKTEIPFVIIIDEWDCVIRNSNDQDLVHKYLQFLHSLFKSEESKSFLALGYITGILPIKKIKDESALNNFQEYTMLDSYPITEYYGFTEKEVKDLCEYQALSLIHISSAFSHLPGRSSGICEGIRFHSRGKPVWFVPTFLK